MGLDDDLERGNFVVGDPHVAHEQAGIMADMSSLAFDYHRHNCGEEDRD